MASDFDPDNRVVKHPQGAVVQQGGNVSSRLPGRTTFTATPAEAVQGMRSFTGTIAGTLKELLSQKGNTQAGGFPLGGPQPTGTTSIEALRGRVEAAAETSVEDERDRTRRGEFMYGEGE